MSTLMVCVLMPKPLFNSVITVFGCFGASFHARSGSDLFKLIVNAWKIVKHVAKQPANFNCEGFWHTIRSKTNSGICIGFGWVGVGWSNNVLLSAATYVVFKGGIDATMIAHVDMVSRPHWYS